MSAGPVAVVDVGSNSVKLLVASLDADGLPVARKVRTIDARISAGIAAERPRLADEGMSRGRDAVIALLADAKAFDPSRIEIVATSAVRDAANGAEFAELVRKATGHAPRILSGDEEAALIGRGLTCDRELAHLRDFRVFDLGGGSLECLSYGDRVLRQAISLPLGCVRMTERFVPDPALPFSAESAAAIEREVKAGLARSGFAFAPPAEAVATGGTITTVRAVRGAREGKSYEETRPIVPVAELRALLKDLGALPLSKRKTIPGLQPERADVFPAALATLTVLAEMAGVDAFRHSVYNLRWGLAAELLGVR